MYLPSEIGAAGKIPLSEARVRQILSVSQQDESWMRWKGVEGPQRDGPLDGPHATRFAGTEMPAPEKGERIMNPFWMRAEGEDGYLEALFSEQSFSD